MKDLEVNQYKVMVKKLKSKVKHAMDLVIQHEKECQNYEGKQLLSFTLNLELDLANRIEQLTVENKKLRELMVVNQNFNSLKSFSEEYKKIELEVKEKNRKQSEISDLKTLQVNT